MGSFTIKSKSISGTTVLKFEQLWPVLTATLEKYLSRSKSEGSEVTLIIFFKSGEQLQVKKFDILKSINIFDRRSHAVGQNGTDFTYRTTQ